MESLNISIDLKITNNRSHPIRWQLHWCGKIVAVFGSIREGIFAEIPIQNEAYRSRISVSDEQIVMRYYDQTLVVGLVPSTPRILQKILDNFDQRIVDSVPLFWLTKIHLFGRHIIEYPPKPQFIKKYDRFPFHFPISLRTQSSFPFNKNI